MDIKELRVDNKVNVNGSKEPRGVTVDDFRLAINGENPYLTPILLTEEWLLKFGFTSSDLVPYDPNDEFHEQYEYKLDSGISHRDFICRPSKGWIVKLGDYEDELEIKYVHQLQNLFFALKGKELTVHYGNP